MAFFGGKKLLFQLTNNKPSLLKSTKLYKHLISEKKTETHPRDQAYRNNISKE